MDSNFMARILICKDCNEEFVFTAEAQEYFSGRGYSDDPLMCKSCYTHSKRDRRGATDNGASGGAILAKPQDTHARGARAGTGNGASGGPKRR